MRILSHLPTALLVLLLERVSSQQYDREGARILQARDAHALSMLGVQQPQAVRKMSPDAGEKFWPHYWEFDEASISTNASTTIADSPLAIHELSSSLFGRALFQRDAACPTSPYNTSSCASIGYPNSCCPVTSYCYTVTDTGNGPVGCCPNGGTCSNAVGSCPAGYTSCPDSSNKGCCIPGYACAESICVNTGTSTAVALPSTSTTTISVSSTTTTTAAAVVSVTTVTLVNISPSGYTTTATVTVTQSASSTSDSAVAPVRPTTDSSSSTVSIAPAAASSTTTTTVSSSTSAASIGAGYCPTGYYVCSAVYSGGCCQVGRDCNTSDCPATASTTVISSSPTIVAPAGASTNAASCANGWFSCPASLGGNCCPSGYNCAQSNCPAIATGAASHDKEAPSEASNPAFSWVLAVTATSVVLGMTFL